MSGECVFCQIVRGEVAAQIVHRDECVVAFLDHSPLLHGHTLVVTREHVESFDQLPDALLGPLFGCVKRMSIAVQRGLGADGSFVATNTKISQSVPHVHVHVVPRRKGDGLFSPKPVWRRTRYASEAQAKEIAAKIARAYAEQEGQPPGRS